MNGVDVGREVLVLRAGPRGAVSARVSVRSGVVCTVLALLVAGLVLASLASGDFEVSPARALEVLRGGGSPREHLVVMTWRMPRVLLAVVGGAALAVSGAIFQSLTRNPLGSPDVIGFTTGAYAGAVLSIIVLRGQGLGTTAGALLGGVVTALVVYLLAYRRGVQGFRLIIVGIGVGQILSAVTTWLILRADLDVALSAAVWGSGSLNGVTWAQFWQVSVVVAVMVPAVLVSGRTLRGLELGEDAAMALGVNIRWAMLWLSVLGIALSAAVVAYCGLIMFVSLAAPQLARRAVRSAGIPLLPSALMGASLLAGSDWVAQHGLGGQQVPVGVVTVSLGGAYLVWLLVQEARR